MPTYLYAVVDDGGRVVKSYTSYSWAEQKAKTRKNYRIVAFVNTENVRMLEIELYTRKGTIKWRRNTSK